MGFTDAKTQIAHKGHTCVCCERIIHPTEQYVSTVGTVNKNLITYNLCFCCAFLLPLKEGVNAGVIIPGEFTDKKIPNRLRKIRNEFYADMDVCLYNYRRELPTDHNSEKKTKRVVVSAEQFNRSLIHVPVNRFNKIEDFIPGEELFVFAGVKGPNKLVTIKTVKEVDGKSFGRQGKCLAILLEKENVR